MAGPGEGDGAPELESVCVFCGSSAGEAGRYTDSATRIGRLLAERGLTLVYGGSRRGLMGRLADAVLDAGGDVVGVIPRAQVHREVAHEGLPDLRVVDSMHERKALMADLAGAFVALPGGLGTLEEFCEVLTWGQLGLHRKACGLLNVHGYFDHLIRFFDHALRQGFLSTAHREMIRVRREPEALLDALQDYAPPAVPRWIEADEI